MRYCFYSGYKDLKGGYTTLLLTLIKELNKQNQEVVLINFADGLIANELKKEGVTVKIIDLDTINWKDVDKQFFSTDIFIITVFDEIYHHFLKINPRFVYYDINDFIGRISAYKFNFKFRSWGRKLVSRLLAANSLFFMDDTSPYNIKEQFDLEVKHPHFLPIPVSVPSENKYLQRTHLTGGILHMTYIGRSVNWKMMPLKKVLADCSGASKEKKIMFTVLVDNKSEVKRFINVDAMETPNFTINVIENMLPSSINEFLLATADIHFGMGTAALDAAKLGIPTILVDYATTDFPAGYKYKWLYETRNYNLGKNLDTLLPGENGISMEELVNIAMSDDSALERFSGSCHQYVLDNHAVNKIVHKLISLCSNATFRISDAKKFVPYYFNTHRLMKKILMR
jgi:hypothetical protein